MSITKIERATRRVSALREQIRIPRIDEARFNELLKAILAIDGEIGITLRNVEEASEDLIVNKGWTTYTKALHNARYAAPSIARLCDVDTAVVVEEHDYSTKDGRGDVQVLRFAGFAHDVEKALAFIELTHALIETEWAHFIETDEYAAMGRSTQVSKRNVFIRHRADEISMWFGRLAGDEMRARLKDEDRRAIAHAKDLRVPKFPKPENKSKGRPKAKS